MKNLIIPFEARLNEIHDESLYTDYANSHSAPTNDFEVSQIIKECKNIGEKITVCGSLTGLNGAAVPSKGHSLSTKNLKNIEYNEMDNTIRIGSGTTFEELEKIILIKSKGKREFPVSPTEKTATIGGAISFNSSGLRSYRLGNVIDYVEKIKVCDQNGNILIINKNDESFIDFVGSEGMLGIIVEVTLKTTIKKNNSWGIMFFFESNEDCTNLINYCESYDQIQAIEYMDKNCFRITEKYKNIMSNLEAIPSVDDKFACSLYLEIYGNNEDEIENIAEKLMEKSIECNSDPDIAWVVSQEEMNKLQSLRHAITECFNMEVAKYNNQDSRIKLVNIDIKWISKNKLEILNYYTDILKETNLEYIIYGHIGSNAPYVNILTKTIDEYLLANKIVEICYKDAIMEGNLILSEFGVGKLKNNIYCNTERIDVINKKMKAKQKYDYNNLFNPTNMFSKKEL